MAADGTERRRQTAYPPACEPRASLGPAVVLDSGGFIVYQQRIAPLGSINFRERGRAAGNRLAPRRRSNQPLLFALVVT